MSRNTRNAIVAFSQQVLGAVSGAVGYFFLARQMPEAEFHLGILGFALGFVGVFLAVQRAFDAAHVKRISEGKPLGACNSTYFLLNTASTLALVGLVWVAVIVWTDVLGKGFQTPLHVRAIQLVVVYQVLNSIGEFVRRTFDGQHRIVIGQVILSTEHVVKGFAMVWVAFNGLEPFIAGSKDAIGIAAAFVLGAAALALTGLTFMLTQPFSKPSWSLAKSYVRFGLPDTLSGTVGQISTNAPTILLQLFWSARDVGYYTAPQRYVQFLPAVATALSTALFPVFSTHHAEGRESSDLIRRMMRVISLALLPVVAFTMVLSEGIIHVLLSDRFLPGATALAVLAVWGYLTAMRMSLAARIKGADRPAEVTRAMTYATVATLVLGVVFVAPSLYGVPLLGLKATGAALALALGQMVGIGHLYRAAASIGEMHLPKFWRHGLILAGTAGVLWLSTLLVSPTDYRFFHLPLAALLSALAAVGFGIVLGELDREDWALVKEVVNPGEWLAFLKEETRRGR